MYTFFFLARSTSATYTLSLHDALPIYDLDPLDGVDVGMHVAHPDADPAQVIGQVFGHALGHHRDRKSTRLNSSHQIISYAVFCLKKKITTLVYHTEPNASCVIAILDLQ